jgi:hypothetical protein
MGTNEVLYMTATLLGLVIFIIGAIPITKSFFNKTKVNPRAYLLVAIANLLCCAGDTILGSVWWAAYGALMSVLFMMFYHLAKRNE